jgi:hypothetical protein
MGKTKLSITSAALNNFTVMLAGLGAAAAGPGQAARQLLSARFKLAAAESGL